MMLNQSFSQNRRSRGSKTKRVLQLTVLLVVVIWLVYQATHSNDKKTVSSNATGDNLSDGHIESYLGRKGGLGYNDKITSETEKEGVNFEESVKENEDDISVEQIEERVQDFTLEDKHEESQENFNDQIGEFREEGIEKQMEQGSTEEGNYVKTTSDMDESTSEKTHQAGYEEASSQEHENSGDPTSHDIAEENQNEHMNSEKNEDDDRHRITTGGEIFNESREDSSEHSARKDPDVSEDPSETGNRIHDFNDQTGVPESEANSLNETDKGKSSESEDTLPGSVYQSEFKETTTMAADSSEGALSITELSDNADQMTKKDVDLTLSENFQNKTDASTDNEESRREADESEAHSDSEAEASGDSTSVNSTVDMGSTDNGHIGIDLSANALNSSTAADESNGGQDKILMPTDNEFTESKAAESQENVESKAENTDNREGTKLGSSPDDGPNVSDVRNDTQPADDTHATESPEGATVKSSISMVISPNQSGEPTGAVGDVEQRKEEF